jgi:hypothetical protein
VSVCFPRFAQLLVGNRPNGDLTPNPFIAYFLNRRSCKVHVHKSMRTRGTHTVLINFLYSLLTSIHTAGTSFSTNREWKPIFTYISVRPSSASVVALVCRLWSERNSHPQAYAAFYCTPTVWKECFKHYCNSEKNISLQVLLFCVYANIYFIKILGKTFDQSCRSC